MARATCPTELWNVARRKLDQLHGAVSRTSLRFPPGNEWEALSGDRKGQDSIRINRQYRICFVWADDGPEQVEINKHYR